MSGIIMLCGQQQFDANDNPLNGGLVYMLQAGTLTPQNGYKDIALANAYTNPVVLDASGRIPLIYFADGLIRIRITDSSGVLQFDFDNIPVLGQSGGSSIVDTTDTSARFNTGDLKQTYGSGPLAGWVRANGGSIGNVNAPATERANPDCQALFMYLWNLNDADLPVMPTRGATAAGDWSATAPWKTVQLPDFRGTFIGGLDGMGQTVTGRLTSHNFGGKAPTVLGAFAGAEWFQLTTNELPSHAHAVSDPSHAHSVSDPSHAHGVNDPSHTHTASTNAQFLTGAGAVGVTGGIGAGIAGININPAATGISIAGAFTGIGIFGALTGIQIAAAGSGNPKYALPPVRLITFYIKL